MKKRILLLLLLINGVLINSFSQDKLAAEKAFVLQLNNILKTSPSFHFDFEDKFTIDSPFAIRKGILSVTLKFINDSASYKVRVATAVKDINQVAWDVYMILECNSKSVTFYQLQNGQNKWEAFRITNLFHIGMVEENGEAINELLNKRLLALKKFYP